MGSILINPSCCIWPKSRVISAWPCVYHCAVLSPALCKLPAWEQHAHLWLNSAVSLYQGPEQPSLSISPHPAQTATRSAQAAESRTRWGCKKEEVKKYASLCRVTPCKQTVVNRTQLHGHWPGPADVWKVAPVRHIMAGLTESHVLLDRLQRQGNSLANLHHHFTKANIIHCSVTFKQ